MLGYFTWQDPGYVYKLRLAVEVFKVTQELNSRLIPFFTFVESKRKGRGKTEEYRIREK